MDRAGSHPAQCKYFLLLSSRVHGVGWNHEWPRHLLKMLSKCEVRNRIKNYKLQFSSFYVERIFGVDLVEASPGVEQDLPDVVHVPLPLVVEAALWKDLGK